MTDVAGDSIYRSMAYVPAGDTIQFKYINGTQWSQNETVPGACAVGGNREVIATGNIIQALCVLTCADHVLYLTPLM
jgi:hypothetical protein